MDIWPSLTKLISNIPNLDGFVGLITKNFSIIKPFWVLGREVLVDNGILTSFGAGLSAVLQVFFLNRIFRINMHYARGGYGHLTTETMNFIMKILLILFLTNSAYGQTINSSVPKIIEPSGRYMFYLHDRIVEERGVNAVHPFVGEYKYLDILDSLKNHDFHVVSEVRPRKTNVILYADKIVKQIDTLIRAGVLPQNIFVLGAGAGAYIGLWISAKAKKNKLNFIFMSPCPGTTKSDFREQMICGNFLSIIETSQNSGPSYLTVLQNRKCITGIQEVKLTLNKREGYYYKPYSEWLIPLINWANKK